MRLPFPNKRPSLRLGGLDFGGAFSVVEDVERGFRLEATHADMNQETGEAAHHFVEEAIPLNL